MISSDIEVGVPFEVNDIKFRIDRKMGAIAQSTWLKRFAKISGISVMGGLSSFLTGIQKAAVRTAAEVFAGSDLSIEDAYEMDEDGNLRRDGDGNPIPSAKFMASVDDMPAMISKMGEDATSGALEKWGEAIALAYAEESFSDELRNRVFQDVSFLRPNDADWTTLAGREEEVLEYGWEVDTVFAVAVLVNFTGSSALLGLFQSARPMLGMILPDLSGLTPSSTT